MSYFLCQLHHPFVVLLSYSPAFPCSLVLRIVGYYGPTPLSDLCHSAALDAPRRHLPFFIVQEPVTQSTSLAALISFPPNYPYPTDYTDLRYLLLWLSSFD